MNGDCLVTDDDSDGESSSSSSCHVRCGEDLVVSNDEDCSKLREPGWKTITVNNGLCSSMEDDWIISEEYSCLQKLVLKPSALMNLNSLTIKSTIKMWLFYLIFLNSLLWSSECHQGSVLP